MSLKALESEDVEVSEGKEWRVPPDCERSLSVRAERLSALRARRATARLPCDGEARMRAMPAPWRKCLAL